MALIRRRSDSDVPVTRSVFSDLLDTDRFFGTDVFNNMFSMNVPAANIRETDNEFIIELAAPGLNKEDFRINVDNGVLSISSEREQETPQSSDDGQGNERYTRREYSYTAFTRSFILPDAIMDDNIQAKYENGVLKIVLPKREEARRKPRQEVKIS
jgi:HSP20 family protein